MIDLHTHSLFSDGELTPAELTRRFEVAGYKALAITDHGDQSNIDLIIPRLVAFCEQINRRQGIRVIPGIELTHVPPEFMPALVSRSREIGARLVVVHGESVVEPVAPGTNRMAIESFVDILAHPGLITEDEVLLAKNQSLKLARLAQKTGAPMVLDSDTHGPGDIWPAVRLHQIVEGAGLTRDDYHTLMENAEAITKRCLT
jgi:histidinol phosphatase-like PHP family hydrolase